MQSETAISQPLATMGAGTPEPPPLADVELLTFRVGDHEYSVDIMSVREIRGWTHATSLPHAPPYVRGVINLRGTVLPVLDLALRLGLDDEGPGERNVIIVVDSEGRTVGLRVDAVSDILTIPQAELQAPPDIAGDTAQVFVRALTLIEGRMVRVLDLRCVMPERQEAAS
jgi:purine-binding chemotaxis protein CheW